MFYTGTITKLRPLFIIKNREAMMKRLIYAMAVACAIIAIPARGQVQNAPYIDMNTTVEREVTPDELYLKITINENDYKGKKNLEEMQNAMFGALKANRIDIPECLTLNYMGSEVSYKLFSKSIKPKTEASYTLKLYDVAIMQKVIASLEERQISNIELVKVKYTKEAELKSSMAIEAMQQAQAEARTLAGAIGQEAGKAISISSWYSGGQESMPRLYKSRNAVSEESAMLDGAAPMPQIGVSKLTYRFNVNVRFELK